MKKNIFLVFISFILEIMISVFFKTSSYWLPLLSFFAILYISVTIKDLKKSLFFCFIAGFFYDITVTSTWFLNATVFTLIAWISKCIEVFIYKNQITYLFSFFGYILLYRVLTYIILLLIGYTSLDIILLFKSILASIIINFFYGLLLMKILKPYNNV